MARLEFFEFPIKFIERLGLAIGDEKGRSPFWVDLDARNLLARVCYRP